MHKKRLGPIIIVMLVLCIAVVIMILLVMAKRREQVGVAAPSETLAAEESTETAESETTTAADTVQTASGGELVDTGVMRTICPSGWLNIPQSDIYGEQDENGNYPVDTETICLAKGASSETEIAYKLVTYVYYFDSAMTENTLADNEQWYDETEEFEYSLNNVECGAFHAKTLSATGDGYYEYGFVFYPIDDSHYIQFSVMTSSPYCEDTISLDDRDVQQIMSNITLD